MKLLSSLIACCFLCFGTGMPNDGIVGSWYLSNRVGGDGIRTTICTTPEIIFYKDGTGTYETNDLPCNFKWKTNNDTIRFFVDSKTDKKTFYFDESIYTFKIGTETRNEIEITWLKLKSQSRDYYYYLAREKSKP